MLEELTFLVLDTNILIHYFDVVQRFTADIENIAVPVLIVIPGIVIRELDG
jgi:predicted ribonuclease YlaK